MNVAVQDLAAANDSVSYAQLPRPFRLRLGGELPSGVIAYESWGQLNADKSNAILLFTGLSPNSHAASTPRNREDGWWERMIGPGRALDTDRFFVLCVNSLGSCYGSTGPASVNPATGRVWQLDFPEITVEDIARAGFEAARTLGVEKLHAVVGPSLGGMVTFAFAAAVPNGARHIISISGSGAASAFAIALRSVQREAVMSDAAWEDGRYTPGNGPRGGMRIARKLGTITYRGAAEWRLRFGRSGLTPRAERAAQQAASRYPEGFGPRFAVEGYLEAQAERFVRVFDPNCYLYLSRAMDGFDLASHGDPVEVFARSGLTSALVIGVETDFLFAIEEQSEAARQLEDAGIPTTFAALPSIEGHDAFLVDLPRFDAAIRGFLATT
ncbi:MAG: homoserine O-acetyltransferase [Steroidobacteraceae bacterium]